MGTGFRELTRHIRLTGQNTGLAQNSSRGAAPSCSVTATAPRVFVWLVAVSPDALVCGGRIAVAADLSGDAWVRLQVAAAAHRAANGRVQGVACSREATTRVGWNVSHSAHSSVEHPKGDHSRQEPACTCGENRALHTLCRVSGGESQNDVATPEYDITYIIGNYGRRSPRRQRGRPTTRTTPLDDS